MVVARIRATRTDLERLRKDAEALCRQALKEGAESASVIACKDLRFRKGKRAGTVRAQAGERPSIHWPFPSYPLDSLKEALGRYRLAVVFRLQTPKAGSEQGKAALEKLYRLVSNLESACFYKGYHLALGLASGNCREVFCSSERRCQAMIKGKPCLHPNKARLSIEACGLDPDALAASLEPSPSAERGRQGSPGLLGMIFVD